jgi:hypothetical protein
MTKKHTDEIELEVRVATLFPTTLLQLDLDNPRLQTGTEVTADSEEHVIDSLFRQRESAVQGARGK